MRDRSLNRVVPRPALLGRRPGLTGVRGVAAVLVVLHHVGATVLDGHGPFFVHAYKGHHGVDIFFVLSGFLITTGLLERAEATGRVDLRDFYRRRALRLGPALLAVLVVWSAYLLWLEIPRGRIETSVGVVATYTTNYYKSADRDVVPGLGHLWTLAVEEHFYLVWPLVLLALLALGIGRRGQVAAVGLGIALITINRAWLFSTTDLDYDVYFRTDTHADGLLWGVVLSLLWRSGRLQPRRWRVMAGCSFVVLLGYAFAPYVDVSGVLPYGIALTLVALASCALILGLLDQDWWLGRAMSVPTLMYLGERSYAIYLWHVPVLVLVLWRYDASPWLQAMAVLLGTLTMAELSWRLVEQPVARYVRRRRNFASRPWIVPEAGHAAG